MLGTIQTKTIQSLLETSQEHDTHKADYRGAAQSFTFNETSRLVPSDGQYSVTPLDPTRWAWGQIFQKLGPVVLGGNRTLPDDQTLYQLFGGSILLADDSVFHRYARIASK